MVRTARSVPPLFLALLITGCLGYKEVRLIGIGEVRLLNFSREGLSVQADVVVDNPNGYRISLLEPDVDVYLTGMPVGKATLDSAVVLDARARRSYTVPLRAQFDGQVSPLLIGLLGAWNTGQLTLAAKGTVVGKAWLLRHRIPFEMEQQVRMQR